MKTIGLFGGTDIQGAVLVNAVTGESQYYEEVPNWVDHVYDANLIMEQYDYYGMYHNGFINSIFGQRDVTHTTEGYNYIAIGDDVYMYTGVTSVTSDQSNIGFILSNQRTKETHFYSVAGATEASAQASAMSQVQQMRYVATFPLLLNIADQPTYFMSLKGEDGLVKMYAMVNVPSIRSWPPAPLYPSVSRPMCASSRTRASPSRKRCLRPPLRAPWPRSAPLCWTATPTTSSAWRARRCSTPSPPPRMRWP